MYLIIVHKKDPKVFLILFEYGLVSVWIIPIKTQIFKNPECGMKPLYVIKGFNIY